MARIIRICSKRDGFRRAGIPHSIKPVDHPADRFSDEQLVALKAEPMLTVVELDVSSTPAAPIKPSAKSADGLSADVAGAQAPATEANSTTDAQDQSEKTESSPNGGAESANTSKDAGGKPDGAASKAPLKVSVKPDKPKKRS